MFGGFAATGAIARTATNIRNGGTSPLAGIVHALVLVLILLLLAPLAVNVPLATLAAILFVIAFHMSEIKHFARMVRRAPRADVAILLITFVLTVFTDLVIAVNIGVILATLHFLRRMASSVEVQQLTDKELHIELQYRGLRKLPSGVLVYAIDGPFFFGAVENFERSLLYVHADPRVLVIRLKRMPFIDITGLQTLEEVIQKLAKRGVQTILCEASPRVKTKLENAEIMALIGVENYADDFADAIRRSEAILESAPSQHERPVMISEFTEAGSKQNDD